MKSERVFLGAAFALLSASWYAPAFAGCVASDSLQLGDQPVVSVCEGSVEGITGAVAVDAISFTPIPINAISTDFQVTLTEPGSGVPAAVSDYINVDPITGVGANGGTLLEGLDVTLVSDNEVPLSVSYGNAVIQETGAWQNLDPLITNFYGWTFSIPAVNVMSDVEVPEPSTWAMMLAGLAGLGFAGYRKTRRGAAPAA